MKDLQDYWIEKNNGLEIKNKVQEIGHHLVEFNEVIKRGKGDRQLYVKLMCSKRPENL